MASFAGRRPSRLWTVEECAVFAARKEFELLKLLATDKGALATARRLGFSTSAGHPHSHPPPVAPAVRAARPPVQQAVVEPRRNARQRRSAQRSAERHAKLYAWHNQCYAHVSGRRVTACTGCLLWKKELIPCERCVSANAPGMCSYAGREEAALQICYKSRDRARSR